MSTKQGLRAFVFSLTVIAAALALLHAARARAAGPRIVDVMPAFWAFESAPHTSLSAQDASFRELVLDPNPDIYGLPEFRRNVTEDGIENYLQKVQPYLPAMRQLSAQVKGEVSAAEQRFLTAFPDFDADVTVVYLPSFMHFDGQTARLRNGKLAVLFGIDGIVRFHGGDADLGVLFSHELFHAYHNQVNPGIFKQQALYAQLWQEGLATYVSAQLNPGASERVVMLDARLADADPGLVPDIARSFLQKFDSTSDDDGKEFFNYGYAGPLPPRSGYLLGYRVCQELGKKYDLRALARLGGDELRTQIRAAIVKLGGIPPAL